MPTRIARRRFDHARPVGLAVASQPVRHPRSLRSWLVAALVLGLATAVAVAGSAGLRGDGEVRSATGASPSLPATADASPPAIAPASVPASVAPAATAAPSSSPSPFGRMAGYRWPLDHARITAAFGPRAGGIFLAGGTAFHDGVDIATFCGDRIEAAHDGTVLVAGRRVDAWLGWVGDIEPYHARLDAKNLWRGRAIMVIVDDGNGYRSVYVHLSRAVVKAGVQVRAGQLLGYEGATGDATGCHLHYSIFSPFETATFASDPAVGKRLSLPPGEIARIDPLGVLPPPEQASVTWGWGARG